MSARFQVGDRVHIGWLGGPLGDDRTPVGEAIVTKDEGVAIYTSEVVVPLSQRWAVTLVARAHYCTDASKEGLAKANAEVERLEALVIEYGGYRCEGCSRVFDSDVTVSCGEEGYFCYPCAGYKMPEAARGAA